MVVAFYSSKEKVGNEKVNIRILNEFDAHLYQELRLSALNTNPEAFSSTYEREVQFSIETVKERIQPSKDKFVLGAFDQSGAIVGMVAFVREMNSRTAHKGNVFGMYVAPELRGHRVGKALILELIKKASKYDGLKQINLTVVSNNQAAKSLYESVGFTSYGIERNAYKYNGQFYDEDLMVLTL